MSDNPNAWPFDLPTTNVLVPASEIPAAEQALGAFPGFNTLAPVAPFPTQRGSLAGSGYSTGLPVNKLSQMQPAVSASPTLPTGGQDFTPFTPFSPITSDMVGSGEDLKSVFAQLLGQGLGQTGLNPHLELLYKFQFLKSLLGTGGQKQLTPIDYDPWKVAQAGAPTYRTVVGSVGPTK